MELLPISLINANMEKLADWNLEDNGKCIIKLFEFPDFKGAVEFINKIAQISEQEEHHPEIKLYDSNKLEIKMFTVSAGGLTEKDFKVAAQIDKI
ncbi:MAG: 4a-hydroxytetrahydrobiopterin dehydratase [Candidatus Pacearchaeota archaeon]|nr:4a-hydroxytetrahydrobiopterin dehydratase [Candidatus Pacearchaeota archaeon]